ncbi:MAG: GNAT family N-acetyltransferase, partial [Gammaproteobacteria bacterium]|nr:GNAT family N-acetyltransferase [Gammaproteobacteria bacterium]
MLYMVQKADIEKATKVLADAFQRDPLWNKICEGESDLDKRFRAIFEVPVRHCLKYGEVYATTEKLEGIAAMVPGKHADMTMWSMIRSGAMGAAMRMGSSVGKKMGPIFKTLTEDRQENMAGDNFLYLLVVGVSSEFQGKGFGGQLIGAAIEKSEREGLPLYLETETEENVKLYEHFGFTLIKKITLPIVNLPMWE